ncbi:MAG: head-tail connector protein [Clostridia bacterium]|nr:head-tail connector protein [Clostridia bacterium]
MIVDVNIVKKFLRIEEDYIEEDDIFKILIDNAKAYIEDSADSFDITNTKQLSKAKLICLVLISDWYENRDFTGKPSDRIRNTIQSLITQLKYCYALEESSGT